MRERIPMYLSLVARTASGSNQSPKYFPWISQTIPSDDRSDSLGWSGGSRSGRPRLPIGRRLPKSSIFGRHHPSTGKAVESENRHIPIKFFLPSTAILTLAPRVVLMLAGVAFESLLLTVRTSDTVGSCTQSQSTRSRSIFRNSQPHTTRSNFTTTTSPRALPSGTSKSRITRMTPCGCQHN